MPLKNELESQNFTFPIYLYNIVLIICEIKLDSDVIMKVMHDNFEINSF